MSDLHQRVNTARRCPACASRSVRTRVTDSIRGRPSDSDARYHCKACGADFDTPAQYTATHPDLAGGATVVDALAGAHALDIVRMADTPVSAGELVDRGIPTATAYRRVDELCEAGILAEAGPRVGTATRPAMHYVRNGRALTLDFASDPVEISWRDSGASTSEHHLPDRL